jgi:hypothetical protein
VRFVARDRSQDFPSVAIQMDLRRYVSDFQLSGSTVRVHLDGCNAVETQEDKVHEVVLGERFFLQMCVDQTQASQTPTSSTALWQVWDEK